MFITEYDGTSCYGWQIQNSVRTVQGDIEEAFKTIFRKNVRITGAGRTDTGVHARGQVAHFDFTEKIDTVRTLRSLNGILDPDIRIKFMQKVADDFHARYSACARKYLYFIAREPVALARNYAWYFTAPLDIEKMNVAAQKIIGKYNFQSFCKALAEVKHYFCTVSESRWHIQDEFLVYTIKADRFLHGMVRALVGTLIDIGRDKLKIDDLDSVFAQKNRLEAGQAAPARGLILEKVYY